MIEVRNAARNQTDHITLVIDMSYSMRPRRAKLIEVVDAEIRHLADKSRSMNREIRVTVYVFDDNVTCILYDMDVLRLPSIAEHYRPDNNTALIDATFVSIQDQRKTGQVYGDHAFLTMVFTDGEENVSQTPARTLAHMLDNLHENETVAVFVPNQQGVFHAKRHGFPAGNIAVWDATTDAGIEKGFRETVRNTYDSYVAMRSTGVRSTRNLFQLGNSDQVNSSNMFKAGMRPLDPSTYVVLETGAVEVIKPFVEARMGSYKLGKAFYELVKKEKVQPQKNILIRATKAPHDVYAGQHARELLGLPDHEVTVEPGANSDYKIFVQSTSVNRKLLKNTELIVLK